MAGNAEKTTVTTVGEFKDQKHEFPLSVRFMTSRAKSPLIVTGVTPFNYGRDKGAHFYALDGGAVSYGDASQLQYAPVDKATKQAFDDMEQAKFLRNRYHNYIGADPEIFAVDKNGAVIPAFEFLDGPTGSYGDYPSAYWDGYQAEFSFSAPSCMDVLVSRISQGLRAIRERANTVVKGARLSPYSTHDIPEQRRYNDPPQFVQFGCTPSVNVYEKSLPQQDGRAVPFRSSGGHMHFSVDKKKLIPNYVKALDSVLGVVCVSLFQKYDDPRRRSMYGRAGEHRLPKYGFEYRVLSSAWMLTPGLVQFVYEMARHIIGNVNAHKGVFPEWVVSEEEVRECINNCDVGLAHSILKRNAVTLRRLLLCMPGGFANVGAVDRFIEAIFAGVHTIVRDPENLSEDWSDRDGPHQWSEALRNLSETDYLDGFRKRK